MPNREAAQRRQALERFIESRDLVIRRWAEEASVSPNTLYNFLKGRSDSLSQRVLESLAVAANVKVSQITGESPLAGSAETRTIRVLGAVQAGAWVEAVQWPETEQFDVAVPIPARDARKAFGLIVRGNSMNLEYPDGTVLICIRLAELDGALLSGDHVIMQRYSKTGQVEATCKELVVDDRQRKAWLWPRSDDPEHQQPISIPWPYTEKAATDYDHIEITSVVIGSYRPRRRG